MIKDMDLEESSSSLQNIPAGTTEKQRKNFSPCDWCPGRYWI
jgi:hypothetical protein